MNESNPPGCAINTCDLSTFSVAGNWCPIPYSNFIACFFNIYVCTKGHWTLKCLKCLETIHSYYGNSHIRACYHADRGPGNGMKVDIMAACGSTMTIDLYYLSVLLPQIMYVQANYQDPEIVNLIDCFAIVSVGSFPLQRKNE